MIVAAVSRDVQPTFPGSSPIMEEKEGFLSVHPTLVNYLGAGADQASCADSAARLLAAHLVLFVVTDTRKMIG